MKWNGQDSIKSWLISLSCCYINSIMSGLGRLSGVLFVASMPRYNVGRQQASFPYTLASSIRSFSSPLGGYLGTKFGVRAISVFGALLGALGVGLCYFAENIVVVTVLWGIVFGVGFCFGNILLPMSINQYFDKYRATASGISYSGSSIGSIVLPPVVEILLNNYGLSPAFLVLAAFLLSCAPAALLLTTPNFDVQYTNFQNEKEEEKQHIISEIHKSVYTLEKNSNKPEMLENAKAENCTVALNDDRFIGKHSFLRYKEKIIKISPQSSLNDYSPQMSTSKQLDIDQITENSKEKNKQEYTILDGDTYILSPENTDKDGSSEKNNVLEKVFKPPGDHYTQTKSIFNISSDILKNQIIRHKKGDNPNELYQNYNYQPDSFKKSSDSNHSATTYSVRSSEEIEKPSHTEVHYTKEKEKETDKQKIENKKPHLVENKSCLGSFNVILDPVFILITITSGFHGSSFLCFITIIIDYSRDIHIEASYEKYILMLLSVGDIIARLGLGWVTDHGHMTRPAFVAACLAFQGLFSAAIGFSKDFTSLAILVTLFGLAQSALVVISPIIIAQYIDKDKQSIAIASYHFLSGPLNLSVSPLIGYFRDEVGAYDWMFYGIGILSVASSLVWIVASYLLHRRKIF